MENQFLNCPKGMSLSSLQNSLLKYVCHFTLLILSHSIDLFDIFCLDWLKENDFYQALYTKSKTKFDSYLQKGTIIQNYTHILVLLRQACDHPILV
jgi:hypothetical protein